VFVEGRAVVRDGTLARADRGGIVRAAERSIARLKELA
jgi:hypothetical protein